MARKLAATLALLAILSPLGALAGSFYRCQVDGKVRFSCCCRHEEACGERAKICGAVRAAGCCDVFQIEPRDQTAALHVSRTLTNEVRALALPVLAQPLADPSRPAAVPFAADSADPRETGGALFLRHRSLRL